MPNARGISRVTFFTAAISSAAMAALLGAAALDIWTENLHFHPTPRINSLTLGFGLAPIPGFSWIVYLWTRTPPDGFFDVVLRVVISGVLVVGVYYSALYALFNAFFVS